MPRVALAGCGTGWRSGGPEVGPEETGGVPREPWSWGWGERVEGTWEQSELRQAAGDSQLL